MKLCNKWACTFAVLSLTIFSCKDDIHIEPVFDAPKKVIVISDIHICDQRAVEGEWGWHIENRQRLVEFLDWVATQSSQYGTLVVAGDMMDEWVAPTHVAPFVDVNGEESDSPSDFFEVLVRDNQPIFDAFRRVKQAGVELVYTPGNHDMTCSASDFDTYLPGLFTQARDAEGLGAYTPKGMNEVVIEHGHRYDFNGMPNPITTPGGLLPIGYAVSKYAASLGWNKRNHHYADDVEFYGNMDAILADPSTKELFDKKTRAAGNNSLTYEQFCEGARYVAQLMTSGENTMTTRADSPDDETNHFIYKMAWTAVFTAKPCSCVEEMMDLLINIPIRFFPPYHKSYSLIEIAPIVEKEPVLWRGIYKADTWEKLQEINHVPVPMSFAAAVLAGGVDPILDSMAALEFFRNEKSDKRIVVFGHTHKGLVYHDKGHLGDCLYANSGTWIDQKWVKEGYETMTYLVLDKPSAHHYDVSLHKWGTATPIAQETLDLK